MTIEVADFWKRMVEGTPHDAPCTCELCLWTLYQKKLRVPIGCSSCRHFREDKTCRAFPQGIPAHFIKEAAVHTKVDPQQVGGVVWTPTGGRPYGRQIFFVNWLIHKVKVEYLVEHKKEKVKQIMTSRGAAWRTDIADYDRAPVSKVRAYLDGLADDESLADTAADLGWINFYLSKMRGQTPRFLKLLDDLAWERHQEWIQGQPAIEKEWATDRADRVLCQGIVDFIRSRPGKAATKRDLERRFSGKRKADLDRALSLAWFFPPLRQRKKGKSTIFYWKPPTREEMLAYNARVEESVLHPAIAKAMREGKEPGQEIFVAYFPDAPKSWGADYWIFITSAAALDAELERFVRSGGQPKAERAVIPSVQAPVPSPRGALQTTRSARPRVRQP
jgi:hypothetical protein